MSPLSWTLIVISVILVIVLSLWLFYNFYWLNQPQIYLVYKQISPSLGGIAFSQTELSSLLAQFNAKFATLVQLNDTGANPGKDPFYKSGDNSNACLSGFTQDGGTDASYFPSWGTETSKCTNDTLGNVCKSNCNSCSCNNQVNKLYSPNGYWLYGPKPSSGSGVWSIAPWSLKKYNKYEIFGINKL